jgi:excisionase family DNA binding protein
VPASIDEMVEQAVVRSIEAALKPYLVKLAEPEPLVYTVSQVAMVLQVSTDTVSRLVKRGVLPRVPHLDGKTLIPKSSVVELLTEAETQPRDRVANDRLGDIGRHIPRTRSSA